MFFFGTRLMSVYLWHVPAIVVLTGVQLLWLPMPVPGSGLWWLTRPLFVIAVLLLMWAISAGTKRWERPRPMLAVVLFIGQSLLISTYGLDLPLAVIALGTTITAVVLTSGSASAKGPPPAPR